MISADTTTTATPQRQPRPGSSPLRPRPTPLGEGPRLTRPATPERSPPYDLSRDTTADTLKVTAIASDLGRRDHIQHRRGHDFGRHGHQLRGDPRPTTSAATTTTTAATLIAKAASFRQDRGCHGHVQHRWGNDLARDAHQCRSDARPTISTEAATSTAATSTVTAAAADAGATPAQQLQLPQPQPRPSRRPSRRAASGRTSGIANAQQQPQATTSAAWSNPAPLGERPRQTRPLMPERPKPHNLRRRNHNH